MLTPVSIWIIGHVYSTSLLDLFRLKNFVEQDEDEDEEDEDGRPIVSVPKRLAFPPRSKSAIIGATNGNGSNVDIKGKGKWMGDDDEDEDDVGEDEVGEDTIKIDVDPQPGGEIDDHLDEEGQFQFKLVIVTLW